MRATDSVRSGAALAKIDITISNESELEIHSITLEKFRIHLTYRFCDVEFIDSKILSYQFSGLCSPQQVGVPHCRIYQHVTGGPWWITHMPLKISLIAHEPIISTLGVYLKVIHIVFLLRRPK